MILRSRGRDITRLEAFSDGVFALSATLLTWGHGAWSRKRRRGPAVVPESFESP
jgi:hypothetical protein